jgi:hypothetical protein
MAFQLGSVADQTNLPEFNDLRCTTLEWRDNLDTAGEDGAALEQ